MYYRTKQIVYNRALVDALLACFMTRPALALMTTPQMQLFITGPAITPDVVIGSYAPPTFHGYAAAVLTLSGGINIGGNDEAVIATSVFTATSGGTINDTAIGYLVVDTTGAIIYAGEFFVAPGFNFAIPGDFLQVDLILPLPMVYAPTVR